MIVFGYLNDFLAESFFQFLHSVLSPNLSFAVPVFIFNVPRLHHLHPPPIHSNLKPFYTLHHLYSLRIQVFVVSYHSAIYS